MIRLQQLPSLALLTLVLMAGFTTAPWPPAQGNATFTVNSVVDAVDANPGNGICTTAGGICTLRAAIQETNALAGADIITLPASP